MMRLVQISDCHLQADPQARARAGFPLRQLEAVVAAVRRERPDRVLVTGDISNDGSPASYQLAIQALDRLGAPWYWLPGNHDAPALMAETRGLPEVLELGGWRLLMLDTTLSGQPHGELGETRLAALAALLEDDSRPTLLAMHHPPLLVGSAWLDALGLEDRDAFWETLEGRAQVRAILCGHIHQAFASRRRFESGEVAVFGCPSTTDQFLAYAETFAVDEASRPGFRIIDLQGDDLATWVERVDL